MNIMKPVILAAMLAAMTTTVPASAADVGVSVSVGQPGFYGRIDIGDYPQPVLISPQPVIIRQPVGVVYDPIYLHVPPGHAKRWARYCGQYGACGRPVYFVQDRWYNDVYVPQYHQRHGDRDWDDHDRHHGDHDRGRGHEHGHGRG